jgi:NAD(P)-dependent dehydrogenase (short-subunit alcohol dehydrogenase family)
VTDRSVVVTGASTGIGRATALRLAGDGWRVFAGVRKEADGERLVADAAPGTRLDPLLLDVTDDAGVDKAFGVVEGAVGSAGLAAVVNNAGTAIGGPVEYLPLDVWRDQFAVNVFGQIAVTKAALPLLRRYRGEGGSRHGRVVFIGSNSGRQAAPMLGPYSASKFAVEGLADTLRMELAGSGVTVVLIEPGAIKTPIWDKGRTLADRLERELPAEALQRYRGLIDATRGAIDMQDSSGAPPEKAAAVVAKALAAKRPLARYQVGADATVSVLAARLLPDRLRDLAMRKLMKI